jgi:hypothetical protein
MTSSRLIRAALLSAMLFLTGCGSSNLWQSLPFVGDLRERAVDDHGIDFVIRTRYGNHYDVQVKSFRLETGNSTPYVFMHKAKFQISPCLLLALVQFVAGETPTLWLVHSFVGGKPSPPLEGRDYECKKSMPEWGLTLSEKKRAQLAVGCRFDTVVSKLE